MRIGLLLRVTVAITDLGRKRGVKYDKETSALVCYLGELRACCCSGSGSAGVLSRTWRRECSVDLYVDPVVVFYIQRFSCRITSLERMPAYGWRPGALI